MLYKFIGKSPLSGPDFNKVLVIPWVNCLGYLENYLRVLEKVLAEAFTGTMAHLGETISNRSRLSIELCSAESILDIDINYRISFLDSDLEI